MSYLWRAARPLQAASLYVLLFLLPFSKSTVEITFGLLLLGWVLERLNPATRAKTIWLSGRLRPLALAVIAYLAACALSILVSDFPGLSVSGFINKWLEYLLFFVIVADVARRPEVMKISLTVLACSTLAVFIHGIAQEVLIATVPYRETMPIFHYGRMTGPYENPIDLATYLMVIIPILLGFSISQRGIRRAGIWAVLLLGLGSLARTEALGAWIGFWIGLLVMMRQSHAIRRAGSIVLIGSLLACAVFLHHSGHLRQTSSPSEIGKVDRLVTWRAAIKMIRDRPVLGHGLNTFMANYLKYWVGGEHQPRYAHNCYLQVAAETGLLGLAAFLWLLWCLGVRLAHSVRFAHGDHRALLLGLCAGLLGFALQAGIDTNFYALRQAALFWVLSGLALGLSDAGSAAEV